VRRYWRRRGASSRTSTRRVSGRALLRRLRVRRRGRDARDRSRERAVGRRPRQRPAALRNAGEPGGLLRRTRSRRQDPLARSEPRRPPLARPPRELHRADLRGRAVRGRRRHRLHRLRGAPRGRRGVRAGHRRLSGYSAYPRTVDWEEIQAAADAVDAYHLADIAHITGLVAAGVHPRRSASPTSSPARRTRRSGPVAAGS